MEVIRLLRVIFGPENHQVHQPAHQPGQQGHTAEKYHHGLFFVEGHIFAHEKTSQKLSLNLMDSSVRLFF